MASEAAPSPAAHGVRVGSLRIAREVARLIERGVFAPGQRLREQELADRFGSSRAPVREALRVLESQGLVVVEQMRGARVVRADEADFLEVVWIRAGLAGVVAQRAAEAGDHDARLRFRDQARAVMDLARNGAGLPEVYAGLRGLTRALGDLSPSPRAQSMLGALSAGREAFQTIGLSTRSRQVQAARLWVRVAEAIVAGDGAAARNGIHALYDLSVRHILAQTGNGGPRLKDVTPAAVSSSPDAAPP
jgi:DNA-binding GntR family transcriptional regulator